MDSADRYPELHREGVFSMCKGVLHLGGRGGQLWALGHCNGFDLVTTVTRWLKATGSLDDLKEMKRCLGSGTRLVYYLILLNLKVLST